MRRLSSRLTVFVLGTLAALPAFAQEAGRFYEENCSLCHTIGGGDLAGPDLLGTTERRDRQWLIRFLLDPEGLVKSGDADAVKLVAKWNDMIMPATAGLTPEMAEALVEYIAEASRRAERGESPGAVAELDAPLVFTDEDRAHGLALFTGRARLAGGGPSCVACHGLGGTPGVAGGLLGPDLSAAHARLGGSRGMTAWLSRPPTPMMRAIYGTTAPTDEEARALTALFEQAATTSVPPGSGRGWLVLMSVAGAIAGLVVMGMVWSGRHTSVRRRLVAGRQGSMR